MDNCN